jgi:hypothetical protein
MALAALSDDPKPEAVADAPVAEATISVKCPHCDFVTAFEARMAGKNAPCQNEECRKIIKVPLPKKIDPKDWRAVQQRPSAAKVDVQELEGAWGNVSTQAVSREAIVGAEADRAEEEPEPRSWIKFAVMGLTAAGVLLLIVVGVAWVMRKRTTGKQGDALKLALEFVAPDPKSKQTKLAKDQSGLVHLLAAQYELSHDRPKEAKEHLSAARAGVDIPGSTSFDRSAALVDIACTQADLAGDSKRVAEGKRFDWDKDKVAAEVRTTLTRLPGGISEEHRDLRSFALRRVTRILGAAGFLSAPAALVNSVIPADERGEQLAIVGLELLALGQRDEAEKVAVQASIVKSESPSLVALWLALGSPDQPDNKQKEAASRASAIAVLPPSGAIPAPLVRVGYAYGWALRGEVDKARKLAWSSGRPEERLRAAISVAQAVIQSRPGETADVEQCLQLLEGELKGRPVSGWLLLQFIEICVRLDKADWADRIASAIADEGLRSWGKFAALKIKLKAQQGQTVAIEMVDDIGRAREAGKPEYLAHWLSVAVISRHNAQVRGIGSIIDDVKKWDVEARRPFGFVGAALSEP